MGISREAGPDRANEGTTEEDGEYEGDLASGDGDGDCCIGSEALDSISISSE
jgi:hypothetical protein